MFCIFQSTGVALSPVGDYATCVCMHVYAYGRTDTPPKHLFFELEKVEALHKRMILPWYGVWFCTFTDLYMCNSVYEGKVKSCEFLCVDICIYKCTFDIENAHNRSLQNFHPGRACQGAEKGGLDFWMKGWGIFAGKPRPFIAFKTMASCMFCFPSTNLFSYLLIIPLSPMTYSR